MTNKEKYKQAFGVLHASAQTMEEIMEHKKAKHLTGKVVGVCLCAVLLLGGAVTAYAYGEEIIRHISGWGGNMDYTRTLDQNGEYNDEILVRVDDLKEPVEITDGRMYLVVNGEHRDITDAILNNPPYRYSYQDPEGYTHTFIIGLTHETLDSYGYGEYIQDASGEIIAGYSARVNIEADGSTVDWLVAAKEELKITK